MSSMLSSAECASRRILPMMRTLNSQFTSFYPLTTLRCRDDTSLSFAAHSLLLGTQFAKMDLLVCVAA